MADELTPEQIDELFGIHFGPIRQAENLARSHALDQTRSWVDPNGYRLSDRVWNQKEETRGKIDARLREAVRTGQDALRVAEDLEQYLDPDLAPTRLRSGKIVRNLRKGVATAKPRDGDGSYPARRLARTEISRAHGHAAIVSANALGALLTWTISGSHPEIDICDEHAERDVGHGAGVYSPKEVPPYPAHPHCLCTLRVTFPESDEEIVARLRRNYGLDPWFLPVQG